MNAIRLSSVDKCVRARHVNFEFMLCADSEVTKRVMHVGAVAAYSELMMVVKAGRGTGQQIK